MSTDNASNPVEVFAGTAVQATMVKSLLENAEIKAYLKDEFTGVIAPWHTTPGGVAAVKVFVAARDYEKAQMVVDEYEKNLNTDGNRYDESE
jgi:hypothetical protein